MDKDFGKIIHRPIDNDNGKFACWINSSLYLVSSHPCILFQYLLLSDKTKPKYDIDKHFYYTLILFNYKYVRSVANPNSSILYGDVFHKRVYDTIVKQDRLGKDLPKYGEIGNSLDVVNLCIDILTSDKSYDEYAYLSIEVTDIRSTDDFNKKLKQIRTITKRNEKTGINETINSNNILYGFTIGERCVEFKDIMQLVDKDVHHWTTYVRKSIDKDNEWYLFDANKVNDYNPVNKDTIYQCFKKGQKKMMVCIYIDIDKYNKIFTNPEILDIYNKFVAAMKPSVYDKEQYINNKKYIESLELELINISKIDLNLLTIEELEIKYKHLIDGRYFQEPDKRGYIKYLLATK